jgi:yersiniabactin synthetase, thiazolinyl reductase component
VSLRVLLCGTGYGATYLNALWNHDSDLRLAGILARGSERSRALATQWNVPLWRTIEEVPEKAIDLACVAVSAPAGAALTLELLRRGIHVLAEHPVAPEDLEKALATAREHGVAYHVNSHYADLETVQPFLSAAIACRRTSPLLFVSIMTNPRALFSVIELLGRMSGGHPDARDERKDLGGRTFPSPRSFRLGTRPQDDMAAKLADEGPFATVQGTLDNVPILLQCQRLVTKDDDGSFLWASHHITAGFASGTLLLAETAGPALWIPASLSLADLSSPAAPAYLANPAWSLLSGPPPATGDFLFRLRDLANRLALRRIAEQIRIGRAWPEQAAEHLLGVSRAWRDILSRLGPFAVVNA